jgi:3-oxoacyl-[acyl-carrier protein] reductase
MGALAERCGHPSQMPRVGVPDEIGSVIPFVASRRSSFMTGANINVDGGTDFC